MADNVAVTAGVGTAIAADDISSVWYQRIKVGVGTDGNYNELQPCSVGGISGATADVTVVGTSAILFGVSWFSTATAAAAISGVYFRDSTSSSTGNILVGFMMSTGQGRTHNGTAWFGPQGINCASGIRVVTNSTIDIHAKAFYMTQS